MFTLCWFLNLFRGPHVRLLPNPRHPRDVSVDSGGSPTIFRGFLSFALVLVAVEPQRFFEVFSFLTPVIAPILRIVVFLHGFIRLADTFYRAYRLLELSVRVARYISNS